MARDKKEDGAQPATTTIRWDHADMSTSYANVVNVSSTREEVTLLFGTNQSWHTGQPELTVKLSDRIIISPFAAKRLLALLSNVVEQYEGRFGQLDIGISDTGAGGEGAGQPS